MRQRDLRNIRWHNVKRNFMIIKYEIGYENHWLGVLVYVQILKCYASQMIPEISSLVTIVGNWES